MYHICEHISYLIYQKGFINEAKMDRLRFGLEVLISQASTFVSIMLLGILSRKFVETLCFCIVFVLLRTMKKGYHCNTFIGCFCLTHIVFLLSISSPQLLKIDVERYLMFAYILSINIYIIKSLIDGFTKRNAKNLFIYLLIGLFIVTSFFQHSDIAVIIVSVMLIDSVFFIYNKKSKKNG